MQPVDPVEVHVMQLSWHFVQAPALMKCPFTQVKHVAGAASVQVAHNGPHLTQ